MTERKQWMLGLLPIGLLLLGLSGCRGSDEVDNPDAEPTLAPILAGTVVVAEAKVAPAQSAALSLMAGGRVAEISVEEGQTVKKGAILLRVDGARASASVLEARAALSIAEAELSRLEKGSDFDDLKSAEAALRVAKADAASASARASGARASLNRVSTTAPADLAVAERRVEEAKNSLWGFQAQRDAICGRVDKRQLVVTQADCDQANANTQAAEERVTLAEIELGRVQGGARAEDVSQARAGLNETLGGASAAGARVEQAEASLSRLIRGASSEDLAIATAAVDRALAVLEQAELNMDETRIRAPFSGTIASIDINEGEHAAPGVPVIRIADTSKWRIETEDLTELDIVDVSKGDSARVRFDAIEDLELIGTVTQIRDFGESRLGDIIYRVVVEPEKSDKRLRWNMTATVEIGKDE